MSESQTKSKRKATGRRSMEDRIRSHILNSSDLQTKSKHGGRRPGAGRKPDPLSIRSLLRSESGEHIYGLSKYEIEVRSYVDKHAHPLVRILAHSPDKDYVGEDDYKNYTRFTPTIISEHNAYRIAHDLWEKQIKLLVKYHRPTIEKFIRQYGNDDHWLSVKAIAKARESLQGYGFEFPEPLEPRPLDRSSLPAELVSKMTAAENEGVA